MKSQLNNVILIIGTLFFLTGCANNYQNVNPTPIEVKELNVENDSLKKLYIKEGFLKGEASGYKKGLEYSQAVISEFLKDIRAKQFSIYLSKERFIEAGAIYINPKTGEYDLGKMEIRKPWTVADLFNTYGAEVPVMSEERLKKEIEKIADEAEVLKSSISPELSKKEEVAQVIDRHNVNGYLVRVYKTKSNENILKKFAYNFGEVDNAYIVKFREKETANNFCNNFSESCISTPLQ